MTKCYLTWQFATQSFQGYYPKTLDESQRKNPKVKTHWSTSRTCGEKWTTEQALTQVVRFLWGKRKKGGHPARHCLGTLCLFFFANTILNKKN